MGGTIRDLIGIDINWKESKFGAQFYHLDIWYSAGLQRRAHVDICTVRNSSFPWREMAWKKIQQFWVTPRETQSLRKGVSTSNSDA